MADPRKPDDKPVDPRKPDAETFGGGNGEPPRPPKPPEPGE